MLNINRLAKIDISVRQSAFLWGARKTGKSTFLHKHFEQSVWYDLLKSDEWARLTAQPHLLREEILALPEASLKYPIIIDEIQKIPALLNEVHWLIENKKCHFILCGSSARKLKQGAVNLLGGRAWKFNFYPFVYKEIANFNLIRALNHGLLPSHYLSDQPHRMLRAYVSDYLTLEIQAEGLVRNLPGFARFIDLIGFCNGQMINYTNIAKDCAINAKTVREYFHIIQDTLIGYLISPFFKRAKRDVISATPKFYLFDVGVATYLRKTKIETLQGTEAGDAFEHFILMELMAFLGLHELDDGIHYWRSKNGLEVDFILNDGNCAIEVKMTQNPALSDVTGLRAFCRDYQPQHALVVCNAPRPRLLGTENGVKILALPWEEFLQALWLRKYY
ncbi:MAG: AAA family ATPase [Gammaproteobacteria bacterium RIFCSPHIGHO2_12_FULL_38_11]|nr:MAG: AAA family ATPase [Gammaproteobacteria bacterium RIFCSPHIGHO2_12_FULL_38_11]